MINTERRRVAQDGFTLVELLIVIVILAILAAIVVFAVGKVDVRCSSSVGELDAEAKVLVGVRLYDCVCEHVECTGPPFADDP